MACASIDSILYSRQTIKVGFQFKKVAQSCGDYPSLEGIEQFTLEEGALGRVLGLFDRGTPATTAQRSPGN